VTFANGGRVFDPSNTAGPFSGKLTPMRRIRLSVVIGTTVLPVFTGFVLGWPISYVDKGADSTVTVSCVDAFRTLSLADCPGSAYGAAVLADSPAYYWPMQAMDATGAMWATNGGGQITPTWSVTSPEVVQWETSTDSTLPLGATSGAANGSGGQATNLAGIGGSAPIIEFWAFIPTATTTAGETYVAVSGTASTSYTSVMIRSNVVEMFYSDATSNTQGNTPVSLTISRLGVPVHVIAVPSSAGLKVYLDGTLAVTQSSTAGTTDSGTTNTLDIQLNGPTLATTGVVSNVAVYPSALTATQIQAHYLAGITAYGHPIGERAGQRIGRILDSVNHPGVDRNLTTGETVLGQWTPASNDALTEIRAIEETEQGLFYISADGEATFRDRQYTYTGTRAVTAQATFGDQAGEIGYTDIVIAGNDIDYVRNTITVSYPTSSSVVVADSASVASYGAQSDSVNASELPTWGGWLARQLGAFRLNARKDPVSRVPSLTIKPLTDLTNYALPLLQLELGDRVRVLRRPTGGSGNYDQYCQVQGVAHRADAAGNWTCTLYLSPAPASYTEGRLLTVNDATYGVIGESATPNLVPY
jgi:hypothetical protein